MNKYSINSKQITSFQKMFNKIIPVFTIHNYNKEEGKESAFHLINEEKKIKIVLFKQVYKNKRDLFKVIIAKYDSDYWYDFISAKSIIYLSQAKERIDKYAKRLIDTKAKDKIEKQQGNENNEFEDKIDEEIIDEDHELLVNDEYLEEVEEYTEEAEKDSEINKEINIEIDTGKDIEIEEDNKKAN